jgi:hypothetical protein
MRHGVSAFQRQYLYGDEVGRGQAADSASMENSESGPFAPRLDERINILLSECSDLVLVAPEQE